MLTPLPSSAIIYKNSHLSIVTESALATRITPALTKHGCYGRWFWNTQSLTFIVLLYDELSSK